MCRWDSVAGVGEEGFPGLQPEPLPCPRLKGCQSQEVILRKDGKKPVFRNTCAYAVGLREGWEGGVLGL